MSCGPATVFSTIQALLAQLFELQREPQERWAAFLTRLAKSVAKTAWTWKETDRHPRGPGCHPNCSLRWDLALNLWDRIYIRKTLTLSDPRHPQRTRDTSHMQAETGTARPGSRQLFLTRSPGVSSPHCHFLQAVALLSLIVF